MRKIAIIGSGGSGKSTLARRLGEVTGIPVIHLDALYWRPNWVATPETTWAATVRGLINQPSWIIDGNYGATMQERLSAADTIIFLDFPRLVCLWRVIKRRCENHGRSRPDMAPGCPEKVDWDFLQWVWTYPKRRRASVLQRLNELREGRHIHVLRSINEVDAFVESVGQSER